jgi:2-polyprenyl-3-methyl-5-hydroxy-6-metoxy-1,4-benzoquinol methylase
MNTIQNNQDPNYYSREYYLSGCSGSKLFTLGGDSPHLLYAYIFNHMNIEVKGKNVLDLGCGRGELCIASLRRGASKVVGLDFSKDAVDIAQEHFNHCDDIKSKNARFIQGNALELSLSQKFDVIFLTDIVEHLYDYQLEILFQKVKEHLSPNGEIVIHTMPTKEFILIGQFFKFLLYFLKGKKFHFLTFKDQADVTHVNLHHREQLARSLKDFNFKIWYDFAEKSFIKRLISKTPLVRLFSGNLWAIATHKNINYHG